ncbi:MAG TPA: UDP-N-acetylglucosamine-peptide N-acetylglucosaminyltransferase, partial [Polyangiaceae bacterium]|nr:UDP-N-acetylglucosamine-peptide N-acetylglucosaminyltransferase [Polyangiaceae bacterium]
GVDPRALMIIDTGPSQEENAPPRCRIFVYQRNVERAAGTVEHLETELVHALEREITAVFLEPDVETKKEARQLN